MPIEPKPSTLSFTKSLFSAKAKNAAATPVKILSAIFYRPKKNKARKAGDI
jgi:hypothetical protein